MCPLQTPDSVGGSVGMGESPGDGLFSGVTRSVPHGLGPSGQPHGDKTQINTHLWKPRFQAPRTPEKTKEVIFLQLYTCTP